MILSMALGACESVVDVDIPREAPKLVANAFINPDSVISVRVSRSKFVLDTTALQVVQGAQVSIFEDDQLRESLRETGKGWYTSTFQPLEGKEYTLRVEATPFQTIEASTFIQPKVPIQSLTYQTSQIDHGTICDGNSCWTMYDTEYQFELTLQDPPGQDHYYEISGFLFHEYMDEKRDDTGNIIGWDTLIIKEDIFLGTEDPAITDLEFGFEEDTYYGSTLAFSDNLFKGKSYTVRFNMNYYNEGHPPQAGEHTIELVLLLKTVDEARYRYLRSKEIQSNNEGNPFAEPINVYSNVVNGYGIFASYSTDTYRFIIK